METFIFYFFSTVLVLASLAVIIVRNPVHAVLFLVLAFFTCAGIWIMLEAEFLALTLILVYVGAVMVLFLFVVMMLDINIAVLREGFMRYLPMGAFMAVIMSIELAMVVGGDHFSLEKMPAPIRHAADYSNTKELGRVLYTEYLYAFELAAVILVVAIIAAIVLTMRKRPDSKFQDPADQVVVSSKDRVRVVKMDSVKRDGEANGS